MNFDELDQIWDATDAAPASNEVPDGDHVAQVVRAAFESTKNGDPMFSWEFVIAGGNFNGRKLFKKSFLVGFDDEKTAENIARFKKDVLSAGGSLHPLSKEEGRVALSESVLDKHVRLHKRTKGTYKNLYINGVAQNVPQGVTIPNDDEDMPF